MSRCTSRYTVSRDLTVTNPRHRACMPRHRPAGARAAALVAARAARTAGGVCSRGRVRWGASTGYGSGCAQCAHLSKQPTLRTAPFQATPTVREPLSCRSRGTCTRAAATCSSGRILDAGAQAAAGRAHTGSPPPGRWLPASEVGEHGPGRRHRVPGQIVNRYAGRAPQQSTAALEGVQAATLGQTQCVLTQQHPPRPRGCSRVEPRHGANTLDADTAEASGVRGIREQRGQRAVELCDGTATDRGRHVAQWCGEHGRVTVRARGHARVQGGVEASGSTGSQSGCAPARGGLVTGLTFTGWSQA